MGYQTVIMILNDFAHEIIKSPKTFTYMCCNAPLSYREADRNQSLYWEAAKNNNESFSGLHQVEVLPTFHADDRKFLMAVGNSISELNVVKYSKSKEGKKLVTLELPDYMQEQDKRYTIKAGQLLTDYRY